MATHHAQPGEVIDVKPLGAALADAKTTTLFKAESVEVIRLVLRAGKVIDKHSAPGEIIVQCLEGQVAFTTLSETKELGPGQLLYLNAAEPHAVRCIEDASLLVSIVRK
ncbi:MAG: cupin domain-containing protein [Planctomycetaceae bacterium]|nr:cupin domain-containing protein [Planctomycetaceae bacterium]MCB9953632.1 cupin domain-containing protein [Planctomycetaceae bacterium]